MVQVGVSLDTIIEKLTGAGNLSAMATAIAKARFLQPNRRFVFKYLDPSGIKPAESRIQALNALLSPQNWVTGADFLPVISVP